MIKLPMVTATSYEELTKAKTYPQSGRYIVKMDNGDIVVADVTLRPVEQGEARTIDEDTQSTCTCFVGQPVVLDPDEWTLAIDLENARLAYEADHKRMEEQMREANERHEAEMAEQKEKCEAVCRETEENCKNKPHHDPFRAQLIIDKTAGNQSDRTDRVGYGKDYGQIAGGQFASEAAQPGSLRLCKNAPCVDRADAEVYQAAGDQNQPAFRSKFFL